MRTTAALPLLLLALALATSAQEPVPGDGLEGRWELAGVEGALRPLAGELVVERAEGGYQVTRTVRRGEEQLVLRGQGTFADGALRVRFAAGGLAGALDDDAPAGVEALYRASGPGRLVGVVRAPGQAVTREVARRQAVDAARLEGRLRVVGQELRDPWGRAVTLRGVNVGLKAAPLLAPHTAEDVRRLVERTGVNFVRLYFAWRAIEPRPLEYDAAYLDAAAAQVRTWAEAGVYVLVDLHQDLWGPPLAGHGAPEWASFGLGERAPRLLPGDVAWQLRYVDPRCYESFEALWSDRVVPASGLGLQEHYARAWQQLARRVAGVERVVGYDPMNEPFMGREIRQGLRDVALRSGFTLLSSGVAAGVSALFGERGFQAELTERLVRKLSRPDRFERIMRALAPANRKFERRLSAFYARVGRAIREVDPDRPLFVEPMPLAGVGVPSEMPHPGLEQLVYAPHLYDAFMDSGYAWDGDTHRVERAFQRHVASAERLGVPLVVGEWGNLPAGTEAYARTVAGLFERAGVGSAYWDHVPGREDEPLFGETVRPYARRLAGRLELFEYQPEARALTMRWVADPHAQAPTVIAAPPAVWPEGVAVAVEGAAEASLQPGLVVVSTRGAGTVTVRVRAR